VVPQRLVNFYEPGQAHKVRQLFSRIAPRYDFINDLQSAGLHRAWKKTVVSLAGAHAGELALDVCCGSGDLALAFERRGVQAVGVDFTEAMLQRAAMRGARLLVHGDAQALPFSDATFDIVTVGYGLRNLSHWEKGLEEMWRVAKPAGRLVVLDFGKPENALWRKIYFGYLRAIVPLFGRVFCGDAAAYAYILESLRVYPAQRGVAEKMTALGCRDVRTLNLLGGAMAINFGLKR
jgi:demethylmenaquinone methyltransferase / 2-methoxy-6-polyprenyl-1,4-benzoquinol methylase